MQKTVTLTVNGQDLTFNMSGAIYDKYINELTLNDKTGPARNMLMRSVAPESKDALKELLALPGAGVQLVSKLVDAYAPDLEICVGE